MIDGVRVGKIEILDKVDECTSSSYENTCPLSIESSTVNTSLVGAGIAGIVNSSVLTVSWFAEIRTCWSSLIKGVKAVRDHLPYATML